MDKEPGIEVFLKWGVDVAARRIFLNGGFGAGDEDLEEFGEGSVEVAIKSLTYLDRTQGKIELWIKSPGGYIDEMWSLYDIIRTRSNVIHTIGFGEVASAGCLILASGDKRSVTENCWFMWHGQTADEGEVSIDTAKARLAFWKRQEDRWVEEMGKRTKRDKAFWQEKTLAGELWLDAKQMVKHGIVDQIIEGR